MTARQVFLVPLLVVVASTAGMAQRPVTDPETIAGPWEVSGPTWTEGVFFSITTYRGGRVDREMITNQDIHVQAYHRRDGRLWWGWWIAKAEDDYYATFDGRHLRTRAGFTLDVMFDPDRQHWSGTWNRDGDMANVVLERPHPSRGAAVSPFCGQWQGVPDPRHPDSASVQFQIAQSRDGTLTAWMNSNEWQGHLFHVKSADQHTITLHADSAIGGIPQYRAELSADALEMVGTWDFAYGLTGGVPAGAPRFRRIGRKDCD